MLAVPAMHSYSIGVPYSNKSTYPKSHIVDIPIQTQARAEEFTGIRQIQVNT